MLGDQPVREAEAGPHVVVHLAPGLGEGVVGQPAGRAARLVGTVLDQLDAQVLGPAGEHPPHRARLLPAQLLEDRVVEAGVRRVAGRHRVAVVAVEGVVEALDQLLVGERLLGHAGEYPMRAPALSGASRWTDLALPRRATPFLASRRCRYASRTRPPPGASRTRRTARIRAGTGCSSDIADAGYDGDRARSARLPARRCRGAAARARRARARAGRRLRLRAAAHAPTGSPTRSRSPGAPASCWPPPAPSTS